MNEYCTDFVNDSTKSWNVWEATDLLVIVPPGELRTTEAYSPTTLYAPYARVHMASDGMIVLTPRPGFVSPPVMDGFVKIILRNEHGQDVETRSIVGVGDIHIPRGVPVPILVPYAHELAKFRELFIIRRNRWRPVEGLPGYVIERSRLEDSWVNRDEDEMKKISMALEAQAALDAQMPGPAERSFAEKPMERREGPPANSISNACKVLAGVERD